MLMLLLNVEYQDVWLSDFSTDTCLGRDLHAYAKKYSRKVWVHKAWLTLTVSQLTHFPALLLADVTCRFMTTMLS